MTGAYVALREAECVHCGLPIVLALWGTTADPTAVQWQHVDNGWRACNGGLAVSHAAPAHKGDVAPGGAA